MSIGKIGEFNITSDNWKLYVERLEQYFLCNSIKPELQVPSLLTVIGAECYELLVNLCTPSKPTTKTFTELTNILEKHLQPKPSVLAERYKFRHRKQEYNESMSNYVAVLKRMSKTCDFGAGLEDSLRDQFVCGINSETVRQRLFAEDNLDFAKAFNLAVSMEAAEKDAAIVKELRPPAGEGTSGLVPCQAIAAGTSRRSSEVARGAWQPRGDERGGSATRGGRGARAGGRRLGAAPMVNQRAAYCKACGGDHGTETCRYTRYVCKVCNKQGHLQRVCPMMTENHSAEVWNVDNQCDSDSGDSDVSDEVIMTPVNQLSIAAYKPILIKLNVQGVDLDMECDTGSAIACINKEVYDRLFSQLELKKCDLRLRYYTGEIVRPVGMVKPLVKYKDKQQYLELYIVENGKTMLLGRQWLTELGISVPVPPKMCNVNNANTVDGEDFDFAGFSSRFYDVFADGLGRYTGGRVGIHLREGARPVFLRARPLAYALREPVERALEQLVRDGVLTPVDRSDWATPIVPVVKKDGTMKAWTATEQDTSLPCCRTLHIKHAAYASALYTLNISILVVLLYSWRIGVNAKRYKELDDVYYGVQIAYFAIIGTQMFMIMLSIILFYGIYKENVAFLVPWVVGCMTFMALEAMAMVYSNILRDHVNRQFDAMCKAEISFLIPRIFLNCLCIWCVLRLYHLLRAGVTWKGAAAIEL